MDLRALERQLDKLKNKLSADKAGTGRLPMIVKSDRGNWDDFNNLFGGK